MENGDERMRDIILLNILDVQHAPSVIERLEFAYLLRCSTGGKFVDVTKRLIWCTCEKI